MTSSISVVPRERISRLLPVGVVTVGVVFVVGLLIAGPSANRPVGLDRAWHHFLSGHRTSFADAVALALNVVGGTESMTAITLALVGFLLVRRRWWSAVSVGATVTIAILLSQLAKSLIDRPRPSNAVLSLGANSFPSGHATAAAAFTVAVALALPRAWTWALAAVWVPLMAWSRNYLLVHWLSDVLAGALLGTGAALTVAGVVVTLRRRQLRQTSMNQSSD